MSVELAPVVAMASSTAIASTSAVITSEREASAVAQSAARAAKRKTPKRAASALYDDSPELDF